MDTKRPAWLTRLGAAVAGGRADLLDALFPEALAGGVPAGDLKETILQAVLFAGYPRAIDAFGRLETCLSGAKPPPAEPDGEDIEARGRALFSKIYGEHTDRVLEKLRGFHPDFERAILRDAYGRVLARPYLQVLERELIAIAMLAALELPRPLHAHVRGAARVGATRDQIHAAIDAAKGVANDEALARGHAVADKFLG
jgi:4-carboxymuconolactone decarboxylase